MDTYNYQALMKLENLERTLSDLLEKVDNEINQTEVEWLHLKNISEAQRSNTGNPSTTDIPLKKEVTEMVQNSQSYCAKMEKESIDDHSINSTMLNLSPLTQNYLNRGSDEEFDSD